MRPQLLLVPLGLLLTHTAGAQTCEARVFAADPASDSFFASALDFDGSEILSGAPGARDGSGSSVGAVHVFERATPTSAWGEVAEIQPASLVQGDNFGASIARDGDTLVVGAPETASVTSGTPGRVFVFERVSSSQWDEVTVLSPPDGVPGDTFGTSVAVDGDTLLVGAPNHDDAVRPGGSTYVYTRDAGGNWSLSQRLDKPQTNGGIGFGEVVAIDGDRACISGPNMSGGAISSGAAFVYARSGGPFAIVDELIPATAGIADRFGASIVLEGDLILVGAPWFNDTASNEGAVWIFVFDPVLVDFVGVGRLSPTQADVTNDFGESLAFDNDRVLVGAPATDSVYVYENPTPVLWSSPRYVRPSLIGGLSSVGNVVALSGDAAVIGDASDSTQGFRSGALYVSDVTLADADFNGISDVCENWWSVSCTQTTPNSTGAFATLEAAGSPFAVDQSLALVARDLPAFQFGLLVASETPGLVPNPGGTQGSLCLGGTIGRFNALIAASDFAGELSLDVPIGAMPPPLPSAVSAGETWYFQVWHRDVNPTPTANFTEAIEITYL
ncbi:MAG: hypothetical protein AAFP86_11220 [Planctomycetota bacterium]